MIKPLAIGVILLCIVVLQLPVFSQESETTNTDTHYSISEILKLAYENNPRISAARSDWQAALKKYPQARSLPDPVINSTWFIEPIETRNGPNDFGFQFMQMIPNPAMLNLKGKKAMKMAEMAQVRFEKTVLNELSNLMNSYYEIGYLNETISIVEGNNEIFNSLLELATIENSSGELASINLYQAETRLAQSRYELELMWDLLSKEISNFKKYLGTEPLFDPELIRLPEFKPVELDPESLRELADQNRHELAMAEISLESAEIDVSLSRTLTQPNFSIGFMYNSIGQSLMSDGMLSSGDDAYAVMFGVSIPIWSGKNRARMSEAESKLDSQKAGFESQQDILDSAFSSVQYKLSNNQRLAILYQDVLYPQAESAVNLAQSLYDAGQTSYSELLETHLVVQNIEIASLRVHADYQQTLLELAKVIGVPAWSITDVKSSKEGGN